MSGSFEWFILHKEGLWVIMPLGDSAKKAYNVYSSTVEPITIKHDKAISIMKSCRCIVEWWTDNRNRKVSSHTLSIIERNDSVLMCESDYNDYDEARLIVYKNEQNIDNNYNHENINEVKDTAIRRYNVISNDVRTGINGKAELMADIVFDVNSDIRQAVYKSIHNLMNNIRAKLVEYKIDEVYSSAKLIKPYMPYIHDLDDTYKIEKIKLYEMKDSDILYSVDSSHGLDSDISVIRHIEANEEWTVV